MTPFIFDAITRNQHETQDTLVHDLSESYFKELIYTGAKLTSAIVWVDVTKALKIRESSFTYTGSNLTSSIKKQYDDDGNVVQTLTSTYTYAAGKLASVDTVRT